MQKVEPKSDLLELNFLRIFQVEDDGVDAVGVADEVIVQDVVVVLTRKLPDAQVASGTQVALKTSRFKLKRK